MVVDRTPVRTSVIELRDRVVGAALRFDERMVGRQCPLPVGPLDLREVPWSEGLEHHWETLRDELEAVLGARVVLPETDELVGEAQGANGSWQTYVMHWYGSWIEQTSRRCPRTVELLRGIPGLQIAGYTVLGAHTHIPRHQGPVRALRYHLGLKVPGQPLDCRLQVGDDVVSWEEGQGLAFDDRTHHEAWNDTDASRYVLFVQTGLTLTGLGSISHRVAHAMVASASRQVPGRAARLDGLLNASGE